MRRRFPLAIVGRANIFAIVLIAAGGCRPAAPIEAANAAASASLERVTVGKPQRKTLVRTTTQPARIEAFEQTPLYAKLAGYVKTLHVDIGDVVATGEPLVTLD